MIKNQNEHSVSSIIKELLLTENQIAHIWSIEDVQIRCTELHDIELTDEQAFSILSDINIDSTIGITWDVIDCYLYDYLSDNDLI